MDTEDYKYEILAKKYMRKLDKETRLKAITAVDDVLSLGKSYKWIYTALIKKAPSAWEEFGFGLFFNKNFQSSVEEAIKRNEASELNDEYSFFEILSDNEDRYVFPKEIKGE